MTESGEGLGVKGYVSMPLGINPKPENCMFLPVPVAIKFAQSERPAREYSFLQGIKLSSIFVV